jgi:hypothetical protein
MVIVYILLYVGGFLSWVLQIAEGGRRSALMTLRRDYDLHFKYTGKV